MQTFQLLSPGMQITVADYGARIIDWVVQVDGQSRHIVLGHKVLQEYYSDPFYLGCVAGPYANRIGNGKVEIDKQTIKLTVNDGINHLHGGPNALERQTWKVIEQSDTELTLHWQSEDGWNGYPGPIDFAVKYAIIGNALYMTMTAQSPKATVCGPTGHSYFNLNGVDSGLSGLAQTIVSNATHFTPKDEDGLPKDKPKAVDQSLFDFSKPVRLDENSAWAILDHNFIFADTAQLTRITSADEKLALTVTSDYPAAQFYTGFYLGDHFEQNQGICVEPHYGADAPKTSGGVHGVLSPDTIQQHSIVYRIELP